MNFRILILIICCTLSQFSIAQIRKFGSPTTIEEYNYLTKGYPEMLRLGLDLKRGYRLDEGKIFGDQYYKFDFKYLVRESSNEIAAILVITKSNYSGSTYYFCIPIKNPELEKDYYEKLSIWDCRITRFYSMYLSRLFWIIDNN